MVVWCGEAGCWVVTKEVWRCNIKVFVRKARVEMIRLTAVRGGEGSGEEAVE